MSKYRHHLPQLGNTFFMTDGGLETTLVFHQGIDLPCFAAFELLKTDEGVETLRRYFDVYMAIARQRRLGVVLEAPTWRANADWGTRLGYDSETLADANRKAIGLLLEIRAAHETPATPMVISGCIGPRGDGYKADSGMSIARARQYHRAQIDTFAATDADMVSAYTINYTEEAIGIVLAARDADIPVVMSFTLETDGRLPSGETLADAIHRTDLESDGYAAYYMINCVHPSHFEHILESNADWCRRIRGLRANASRLSHAELDACTELDMGNPLELGDHYRQLRRFLPELNIVGGCCGTDHRHVEAICAACV